MPASAHVPGGIVSHLQGQAHVIPSGEKEARPLKVGDAIQPGDVILAEADTQLRITDERGQSWSPQDVQVDVADAPATPSSAMAGKPGHDAGHAGHHVADDKHHGHAVHQHVDKDVDAAIDAVNRGEQGDAAAAGLGGGGSGSGSLGEGLRVERVIETVTPQAFSYDAAERAPSEPLGGTTHAWTGPSSTSPKSAADAPQAPDTPHAPQPPDTPQTPDTPHDNHPPTFTANGALDFDPIRGNYKVETDEDTPVSGQVKATDPDGDALTYSKGSDPSHGTVTVDADGNWTYTPEKDGHQPDSFTIDVSDGHGGKATATVLVGIREVNDAPRFDDNGNAGFDPVTGNYAAQTRENVPVSGKVQATDADGDDLSFAKGSDPEHGTVAVHPDGTWTYTPDKDYHGDDSFSITVDDGRGGTATTTVALGIAENHAPKFEDAGSEGGNAIFDPVTGDYHVRTDEDQQVSGKVSASDLDQDTMSFGKGSDPKHGTVEVNEDGSWTYTPKGDDTRDDAFTITVSDGHGGTATTTIHIGIDPANDAPQNNGQGNGDFDPVQGIYLTDESQPASGHAPGTDVNHPPVVSAHADGHNILGIVDLDVNPFVHLSKDDHVSVQDADNNLVRVDVSVDSFLSIGELLGDHSKLSVSMDGSLTQGLHITGNDTRHITIESSNGHPLDVDQVNDVLATLSYDPAHVLGVVSAELLPRMTITATDAEGASDTRTVSSSLVAVGLDTTVLSSEGDKTVDVATAHGAGSGAQADHLGSEVFAWHLTDHAAHNNSAANSGSTAHTTHVDTIHDFDCAARSAGGDVLDLRDLLHVDDTTAGATASAGSTVPIDKLLNFLDFDTQSQPGNTVIHVSSSGGFQADAASGQSLSEGCPDQQHIVLANCDLRASMGLDAHANDHQVIAELVQRGKLLVDHNG